MRFVVPGSGASARLNSVSAVIASNRTTSVTATANGISGAYVITTSSRGATTTARFSLRNVALNGAAMGRVTVGSASVATMPSASPMAPKLSVASKTLPAKSSVAALPSTTLATAPRLTQFTRGSSTVLPDYSNYELTALGELRRRTPQGRYQWSTIATGVLSFTVVPSGDLFALNDQHTLRRLRAGATGRRWTPKCNRLRCVRTARSLR